jgi:hypothetical protein
MKYKPSIRKFFYRSSFARYCISFVSNLIGRTQSLDISHINSYVDQKSIGPLQQPEALLLYSIVKTTLPQTIVEFGFFHGHSAFNFLQAMPEHARLYSYEISDESAERAAKEFPRDGRFKFIHKSQTDFCPTDIDSRKIDLVFFDAAHDLKLNQQTFELIYPYLSAEAILCIHDTGLWNKEHFLEVHSNFVRSDSGKNWVDKSSYAHQNEERMFVNWILDTYPAFQAVHFHSMQTLRHGLSILQQNRKLSVVEE